MARLCKLVACIWYLVSIRAKRSFFLFCQVSAYAHKLFSVGLRGLDELGHPTAGTFGISPRDEVSMHVNTILYIHNGRHAGRMRYQVCTYIYRRWGCMRVWQVEVAGKCLYIAQTLA